MKRNLVHMSDIKLASYIDDPKYGIGYINLHGFNADAGQDFKNALLTLRFNSEIGDLKGLILDLRGNPGGLLESAIDIASYLLPNNVEIVSSKSRNPDEIIVYKSSKTSIRPILKENGFPIPIILVFQLILI